LPQFLKDLRRDMLYIMWELLVVIIKVAFIYTLITAATDLHHDMALETAILIGAVDFLNGQRTQFRTVSDVKERITLSEKGKRWTSTISKHTTKRG
jgi:hypothetical protein